MDEPATGTGPFISPLAGHRSVVGTHHIGASTKQAQRSVADGTSEVIRAFAAGTPINCVNLQTGSDSAACLTIRHLDRVGVLANVFAVLRANGLNVQQMQNQVFNGGDAAVATINVSAIPPESAILAIRDIDEVLNVVATGQTR